MSPTKLAVPFLVALAALGCGGQRDASARNAAGTTAGRTGAGGDGGAGGGSPIVGGGSATGGGSVTPCLAPSGPLDALPDVPVDVPADFAAWGRSPLLAAGPNGDAAVAWTSGHQVLARRYDL